jgi:hypothetical protein
MYVYVKYITDMSDVLLHEVLRTMATVQNFKVVSDIKAVKITEFLTNLYY